jgi:hypothetical protein
MHLLAVFVGLGAPALMSGWFLNAISSSSLGVLPKAVSGSFAASLMIASLSISGMGVSGSDFQRSGDLIIKRIDTKVNPADHFTKPIGPIKLSRGRKVRGPCREATRPRPEDPS